MGEVEVATDGMGVPLVMHVDDVLRIVEGVEELCELLGLELGPRERRDWKDTMAEVKRRVTTAREGLASALAQVLSLEEEAERRQNADSAEGSRLREAVGVSPLATFEATLNKVQSLRQQTFGPRPAPEQAAREQALEAATRLLTTEECPPSVDDVVVLASWLVSGDTDATLTAVKDMRSEFRVAPAELRVSP